MKISLSLALIACLLVIASCKKDEVAPKQTESEKNTAMLTAGTGKWLPASTAGITVDGLDVTGDLFKDFTITFTSDKIFTTGTTPVWLREDSWHFKDESGTVMLRGQDDK